MLGVFSRTIVSPPEELVAAGSRTPSPKTTSTAPETISLQKLEERLWWTEPTMDPASQSPSSRYKGVVPQPSGFWGSQICNQHHPIWGGSFETQEAAASMFRGREAILNFGPPTHEEDENEVEEQTMEENEGKEEPYAVQEEQREHMFDKPLTPSDVGKLNRLVIPKQYAEKYFPLGGDSAEKGLLLSFEDELAKPWRFRYSYWTSSQSYVLTKGWSRFVKEKRLDAGDVVSFDRCRYDGQRLFIRWRRRTLPVPGQDSGVAQVLGGAPTPTGAWTRLFYSAPSYPSHPHGSLLYQPACLHAGVEPVVQNRATAPGNSKRLRLFGVNLDCQLDETEPPTPDNVSLSSQGPAHLAYSPAHGSSRDDHMEFNSWIDVNRPRNRRGDLSM